ncbi:MAG: hypothetical protein DSY55_00295, partial [Clostridia bacterium]
MRHSLIITRSERFSKRARQAYNTLMPDYPHAAHLLAHTPARARVRADMMRGLARAVGGARG